MKRILLLSLLFSITIAFSAMAQERTVSGTVTDDGGEPFPGVTISIKGTTIGTTTDVDGSFRLSVNDDATLVFSFVGFESREVEVGSSTVIDISLTKLQAVITGVGSATHRDKLSFVVEKVDQEMFDNAPVGITAVGALAGKVAGVRITNGSGQPGTSPDILLRAPASLLRSNAPLLIIDGVLLQGQGGGISDINGDDVRSIEIVKGASAAALYGSLGSNGVINIITKRGSDAKPGETIVKVRMEHGKSFVPYKPKKTTSTNKIPYTRNDERMDPTGTVIEGFPSNVIQPSAIYNIKWPVVFDHFDQVLAGQNFSTHYVSLQNNAGNTSVFASAQLSNQEGVILLTDGNKRTNLRVNVDHTLNEKLRLSASNLYSFSTTDLDGTQGTGVSTNPMLTLWRLDPSADLLAPNSDGSPYNWMPGYLGYEINPLYAIDVVVNDRARSRFLGNYQLSYSLTDFLDVGASFSIDKLTQTRNKFVGRDYYFGPGNNGPINLVDYEVFDNNSETLVLNANFFRQFGDLTARLRLRYFYENAETLEVQARGSNLQVDGLNNLENAHPTTLSTENFQTRITANNFSGILALDYRDTYLFDALIGRDGASSFGANQRWQTFGRVSGAYRITQDFDVPGFQELRVRGAWGVAGGRPNYGDQYEVIPVNDGNIGSVTQVSNPDLRPSINRELELGFDAGFLDKFSLSFNYVIGTNTNILMPVPLVTAITGDTMIRNAATLESNTIEATLGYDIFRNQDWSISANIVFDKSKTEITRLGRENFDVGPDGAFRLAEGSAFGIIHGYVLATSLDQVENQVAENQTAADVFTINNHGFVVRRDEIGTIDEVPIYVVDQRGDRVEAQVGDINPDFNMGVNYTVRWKDVTLFMQWDWQQGGDVYNKTFQFGVRDNNVEFTDQSLLPANQQKSFKYTNALYNVNRINNFFVEDGTFVKLRELSLGYTFSNDALSKVGLADAFKKVKVSVIGRNLLTFTNYSGFDPEVGQGEGSIGAGIYRYDNFQYPNFSTLTGSVEFTF